MKSNQIILLLLLSLLTFSCSDTLNDMGVGVRPSSDAITVQTDTFHVSTLNVLVESISSRSDSFLLGRFYDAKYGTIQADILAQVEAPAVLPTGVVFTYPPGAVADSTVVMLHYNTWFGDKYAPLDVNIYQMNKMTFDYLGTYLSNLDPLMYTDCSDNNRLAQRTVTARDALYTLKGDSTYLKFKLSDNFTKHFFDEGKSKYASRDQFTSFFNGLYVTTNYGSSSVLNVSQLDLNLYYHYTYLSKTSAGKDTTITVKQCQPFPANGLVRQVNRLSYPDRAKVLVELNKKDSFNYISSPANIQTSVVLPLKNMNNVTNAKTVGKKRTINSATLRVEVAEVDASALAAPAIRYMLLVKEADMNFSELSMPSENAVLGVYSGVLNTAKTAYDYYYSFNIAKIVAAEFSKSIVLDNLKMMLVPVRATFDANGNVTLVKKESRISAVTVRSGKHKTSPMKINMVYSGF